MGGVYKMKVMGNTQIKDGDGDEEEFSSTNLAIETVGNGWILRVTDEEDVESCEVFDFSNVDKLMIAIREALRVLD